jgi:type VI secretion system protein ImpC
MADPKTQQQATSEIGATEVSDFDSLIRKEFKPKTDEAKEAVERAVRTLAEQALSQTKLIGSDVVKSIEAIIAQLDKKLTEQINLILHHDDFQKLEGAWRGLHYLVSNTETDEMLKIRFMNISRPISEDAQAVQGRPGIRARCSRRSTRRNTGSSAASLSAAWSATTISTRPRLTWSCSERWPRSSAAAHTPFIAAASPTIMQMSSWQEAGQPAGSDEDFTTPEYAAWRSLRESEDARYLGLAMPRFSRGPARRQDESG